MLGHLSAAVGVLVAVLGAVRSNNAAEQHALIGFTEGLTQFRLHLIPTQGAGKNLIWPLNQVVFHVATNCFLSAHNDFSFLQRPYALTRDTSKTKQGLVTSVA